MRYQLIGVNHKSAPLEVRERLAIPESRLPDCCRDLTAHPGVEEGSEFSSGTGRMMMQLRIWPSFATSVTL